MYTEEKCELEQAKPFPFSYLAYTPEGYDGSKPYPLVVFLHGAGERGEDLSLVARHGFFEHVKEGHKYPFLMVGPQCPKGKYWGNYIESLNLFLDHIQEKYNVDKSRIYLTGLSMGGTGTWLWLLANPERFAAAAPVCGTGIYWYTDSIANKPVWMFHGDEDEIVPIQESYNMVQSMKRWGKEPRLTVLKGVGHKAWNYAYHDELAEWFLQYRLSETE